jgi:hypothetical protein
MSCINYIASNVNAILNQGLMIIWKEAVMVCLKESESDTEVQIVDARPKFERGASANTKQECQLFNREIRLFVRLFVLRSESP